MNKIQVFVCFFLAILCPTEARRNSVQIIFENHLALAPNKLDLASNETFIRQMFHSFRSRYPYRARKPANETARYRAFEKNIKNAVTSDVEANRTFTVGLNKFSDWTATELQILRGNRPPPSAVRAKFVTVSAFPAQGTQSLQKKNGQSSTKTATFDYTERVSAVDTSASIIRPVRDQGQCGSCYAFAIITLIEAQCAFRFGKAINMSEQQIIDCSTEDAGCIGGYFDNSFDYLQSYNWYMDSASNYPYKDTASNCTASKSNALPIGNVTYRHLPSGNASAMQQALVNFGPIWISIYVGSDCSSSSASSCPVKPTDAVNIMNTFQSYTSGVYQASGCTTSADNNNHAMVVVGYGYDSATKLPYWKLRNSWGEGWGEDGYMRIRRGVNMCNVESDAFIIAKPAP